MMDDIDVHEDFDNAMDRPAYQAGYAAGVEAGRRELSKDVRRAIKDATKPDVYGSRWAGYTPEDAAGVVVGALDAVLAADDQEPPIPCSCGRPGCTYDYHHGNTHHLTTDDQEADDGE